jgi:hypothetical protein
MSSASLSAVSVECFNVELIEAVREQSADSAELALSWYSRQSRKSVRRPENLPLPYKEGPEIKSFRSNYKSARNRNKSPRKSTKIDPSLSADTY